MPFDPDWDPNDPDRTCYTCGAKPSHRDMKNGSPMYSCPSHGPVTSPAGWLPPAPFDIDEQITTARGTRKDRP